VTCTTAQPQESEQTHHYHHTHTHNTPELGVQTENKKLGYFSAGTGGKVRIREWREPSLHHEPATIHHSVDGTRRCLEKEGGSNTLLGEADTCS